MDLAHIQYSLCGIATIIGHTENQALLCENNKFFSTLTTIPVSDIDDPTMGLEVTVPDSKDGPKTMTVCKFFQQQDWCLQVEPTQTPGKLLFVTTKGQVSASHKWLDNNLEHLFKDLLPCNPQFQQSTKIPHRLDKIPVSNSMFTYAQTLCRSIVAATSNPNKDKKYAWLLSLPKGPLKYVYDPKDFPALTSAKLQGSSNLASPCNSNTSDSSFSSDEQPTSSTKTSTNVTPTVDLTTLKEEIKQEIKNSLLEEFNAIIRQEIDAMHSELQSLHQQPSTEKLPDPKTVLNFCCQRSACRSACRI